MVEMEQTRGKERRKDDRQNGMKEEHKILLLQPPPLSHGRVHDRKSIPTQKQMEIQMCLGLNLKLPCTSSKQCMSRLLSLFEPCFTHW